MNALIFLFFFIAKFKIKFESKPPLKKIPTGTSLLNLKFIEEANKLLKFSWMSVNFC